MAQRSQKLTLEIELDPDQRQKIKKDLYRLAHQFDTGKGDKVTALQVLDQFAHELKEYYVV